MYLGIYSFFSIFLYINHIYTDTIFTLLSLLSIYIYVVNKKYLLLSILILAISYFIRPVSAIYLIAILIIELFDTSSIYRKKLFRITSSILLFIAIYGLFQYGIDKQLKHKELRIPAASYLYMGFNQEEFGFQDNRHSTTLTLSDVKERISSYSFVDVLNIITKKAYWTWTEGTFQAERYAFGNAVENETEKFQYSTFITKYIKNPTQKAYKYLESFMRAQYYYLLLFALIGAFIVRKKRNFDIIFLLFVGFFIFYLFWEIKSRYLISLYPFYFIFSFNCISRNK